MTTWNKLNWTLQLGVHKQDHWRKKREISKLKLTIPAKLMHILSTYKLEQGEF